MCLGVCAWALALFAVIKRAEWLGGEAWRKVLKRFFRIGRCLIEKAVFLAAIYSESRAQQRQLCEP